MVKLLSAAQFSFLSLFARYLTLNKIMGYHVLKTADNEGRTGAITDYNSSFHWYSIVINMNQSVIRV